MSWLVTVRRSAAVASLALAGLQDNALGQGFPVRVVAVSGEQAPGLDPGVVYDALILSSASAARHMAWVGSVTGPGVVEGNRYGVWAGEQGSPDLFARQGAPAPGAPAGATFRWLGLPVTNESGYVAFAAYLALFPGDLSNNSGVWAGPAGNLMCAIKRGDAAPGLPGLTVDFVGQPALGGGGHLAFRGGVAGPGVHTLNNLVLWAGQGSALSLLARQGSQVPGCPEGVAFDGFAYEPLVDDAGRVAFLGWLRGPGITSLNAEGIWTGHAGGLALIARSGDPAPGAPGGVLTSGLGRPVQGASGLVAFSAGVTGLNAPSGVWAGVPGDVRPVLLGGDPVPGLPPDVRFDGGVPTAISNAGRIALVGHISGPGIDGSNGAGIWTADEEHGIVQVMRRGDPVPELGEGVRFAGVGDPSMDARGTVIFRSALTGPGVTPENGSGFWASDPRRGVVTVIRGGDRIEIAPGDVRTVRAVVPQSTPPDVLITDEGVLVCRVSFSDFSEAILRIRVGYECAPDWDSDGTADATDISVFLTAWLASAMNGTFAADYDRNRRVNSSDIAAFLTDWIAAVSGGC